MERAGLSCTQGLKSQEEAVTMFLVKEKMIEMSLEIERMHQ